MTVVPFTVRELVLLGLTAVLVLLLWVAIRKVQQIRQELRQARDKLQQQSKDQT